MIGTKHPTYQYFILVNLIHNFLMNFNSCHSNPAIIKVEDADYDIQSTPESQRQLLTDYDPQIGDPLIVDQPVIRQQSVFQELKLRVFESGLRAHCKYPPDT